MLNSKLEHLKKKLSDKFDKTIEIINQDIHIKDIYLYPVSKYEDTFGEFHHQQNKTCPSLIRLIDHISLLAHIANCYHEEHYCIKDNKGHYVLKEDCTNKITRLSLYEFSLYTAKPLSLSEFNQLYEKILNIARKQQDNVHLVLSSLAVKLIDNTIVNIALYVQCGREAKIESIAKAHASDVDPQYQFTTNYKQVDRIKTEYKLVNHKEQVNYDNKGISFIVGIKGEIIPSRNIFEISTAGGAKYYQAVEICLDHVIQHAKKILTDSIYYNESTLNNYIPRQANELITSNYCFTKQDALFADNFFNINPRIYIREHKTLLAYKNNLIDHKIKEKYNNLSIHHLKTGILINHPPFGGNYILIASEEKKLSGYKDTLNKEIMIHNQKIKKHVIQYAISQTALYKKIKFQQKLIRHYVNDLYEENQEIMIKKKITYF